MVRLISDSSKLGQGANLQVIGAGLSRSATSSLQAAFESSTLGLSPCMHMAQIVPHPDREQIILDAMRETDTHKRHKLLHKIYDGNASATDFPVWWFIDDLMDMYPDAKIVLNQRKDGARSWMKSMNQSLGFFWTWQYMAVCLLWKTDRLHWRIHNIAAKQCKQKWGVERSAEFYDVYQAFVLQEAKKRGREVLVWKAEDGWAPLCKFLGKEAPSKPFPWVNDAATMRTVKYILIIRGLVGWSGLAGGLYASWRYWPDVIKTTSRIMDYLGQAASLA